MRWRRVSLDAWGGFDGRELALDDPSPGLHVIHGPNEAGKSTAMRGLRALLFGVPLRTTDNFKHAYDQLRLSAEIEGQHGEHLCFTRRKRAKNSLVGPDESVLPDSVLEAYLGGVTAEVYDRVFSMDHPSLVAGGEALAGGGGSAHEVLFQAGAGMTHLRRMMRSIDEEAGALYKESGTRSIVNQALSRAKAAAKRATELSMRPREWVMMDEQRQALTAERDSIMAELSRIESKRRELERVRQGIPAVTLRRSSLAEREALGDVVLLDKGARESRLELERAEEHARAEVARVGKRVESIERELTEIEIPEGLLAAAETVRRLMQRLAGYRHALEELPKREADARHHEREARRLLDSLRPGWTFAEAAACQLASGDRSSIEQLMEKSVLNDQARKTLEKRRTALRDQRRALDECDEDESDLAQEKCAAADSDDLGGLLRRMDRKGDLEGAVAKLESAEKRSASEMAQALKRLGRWEGGWEDLMALPLPELEVVAEFEERFAAADLHQRELAGRRASAEAERKRYEEDLAKIRQTGAAPSELDLQASRGRRDEHWDSLRSAAEQGSPWDGVLASQLDESIKEADLVSDRLRSEARQMEQEAALSAQLRSKDHELKEVLAALQQSEAADAQLRGEWAGMWSKLAIDPAAPKVMRAWLGKVEELRRNVESWQGLKSQRDESRRELEEARGQVVKALTDHGCRLASEAMFIDLVDQLREYVKTLARVEKERENRQTEKRRLQRELSTLEEDLHTQEAEEDRWRSAWAEAVARIGFDAAASVAAVRTGLESWGLFWAEWQQHHRTAEAAEDLRRQIQTFEGSVDELRGLAAGSDAKLPTELCLSRLEERIRKAESDSEQRSKLSRQLIVEKASAAEAEDAVRELSMRLRSLMERARCQDRDGLLRAEERSERFRELSAVIEGAESDLRRLQPEEALDVFARRVSAWTDVAVEDELQSLAEEASECGNRRVELERQLAVIETQMRERDGGDAAALAREESESCMAEAESSAVRYGHLRLAEFFLRRHMERYMERNQGPVLSLGSEIFQRLTLGQYARIIPDFNDKDEPILKAGRENGLSVTVDGLSDGTRDQLFLSLRLASLEQRLSSGQVFPLIVDDLLLTFDDQRAAAALRELARLAKRTQVLFFTHHWHLVELVRKTLRPGEFSLQELGN